MSQTPSRNQNPLPGQLPLFPAESPPESAAPESLRLFEPPDGDEPAEEDSAQPPAWPWQRLTEFYQSYFLPVALLAEGAAERNIKQYAGSLNYWVRFTGDPPLDKIGVVTIARFMTGLQSLPGIDGPIATNTIRKHAVHIQAILDRAGPRSRRRDAAGVLKEVPWIRKPEAEINDVEDVFTLDEIGGIWGAAAATLNKHLARLRPSPRAWLLSWYQLLYLCGPRPGTLASLRWRFFSRDESGVWAKIPVRTRGIKNVKGRKSLLMYFNGAATEALERMRSARDDDDLVFAHDYSEAYFQRARERLLERAGISPERRFGFRGLRKACNTEVQRINPAAAKLAMGHSRGRDVNLDHYTHRKILAEALDRLPVPAIRYPSGQRQLDLF